MHDTSCHVSPTCSHTLSGLLSSSLARCWRPRVHAKIEAMGFVEVLFPFWYSRQCRVTVPCAASDCSSNRIESNGTDWNRIESNWTNLNGREWIITPLSHVRAREPASDVSHTNKPSCLDKKDSSSGGSPTNFFLTAIACFQTNQLQLQALSSSLSFCRTPWLCL